MKFGKAFKKQKVPEWTAAYVDYNGLKHILQGIREFKESKQPPTPLRALQQRLTLHRAFSGLNIQENNVQNTGDIEDQVIAVNTVQEENSRKLYNTKFLLSPKEGRQDEIMFFEKLDDELNKVNTFYKDKMEEVMKEAALLNKQMDALIALRIKVMNPNFDGSSPPIQLSADINSSAPLKVTSPSGAKTGGGCKRMESTDLTSEVEMSFQMQDSSTQVRLDTESTANGAIVKEENANGYDSAFPEILDRVKITNTFESPISTIKGVIKDSKEKDLSYKKQELREVEERLKLVFVEFYRKLHLLKQYSFINLSAFSKILKKYEKITSRDVARSYMKMVDDSYLGSCDEVISLLNRVEVIFVKHFSNSNRREGMKLLRPKQKREKHSTTFFSGCLSGCSIALLIAVFLLIRARRIVDKEESNLYVDTIFPLYSFFAYIVLHMLLYAANIYYWRRYRINYPFIFGFKQGTELGYREVFLFSNGLAVLALATFLIHLHLKMDSRNQDTESYIESLPLGLIIVVLAIMFCPFNIIYRSSRYFLIRCLFHCMCAPFYKVTLSDFFLADQLTSQVQAIRSLEYYMCYYFWRTFTQRRNMCHSSGVYNVFYFIVAVIPYWLRFLQCVRRLFEEKDFVHGCNGLRYFLTIIAVVVRTAFELRKRVVWKVLALVSSAIATLVNTYWDIVVDWGLLQRKSRNLFLRDKLVISHRSVYFAAMVLDILLRFAWLQLVLTFDVHSLRGNTISSIFSCLEILRRGMWNFFRLENEHLNNVGKYRAFKSVPLPFHYNDEIVDKDD